MRYGSVCSGIEAASVAWESLGWQPAWFAEIEAFPSAVLATGKSITHMFYDSRPIESFCFFPQCLINVVFLPVIQTVSYRWFFL